MPRRRRVRPRPYPAPRRQSVPGQPRESCTETKALEKCGEMPCLARLCRLSRLKHSSPDSRVGSGLVPSESPKEVHSPGAYRKATRNAARESGQISALRESVVARELVVDCGASSGRICWHAPLVPRTGSPHFPKTNRLLHG